MSPRPRLRPGVVFRPMTSKEGPFVMVKEPQAQKYYQFDFWTDKFFPLLDGTRDADELVEALAVACPEVGADLPYVLDLLETLRTMGLLERSERERHLVMLDKVKTFRKRRFYDAESATLFQIEIPLFDPDRLLDRVIPWIRWLWAPGFVLAWMVVFAAVIGFLVAHWGLYWRGFFSLWNFPEKSFGEWVGFFALMFGVSMWHEMGHGLTCKRFGGEVHAIGILIFYLQPAFYCRIDDAYMFPNRFHRMYSSFGGAYLELMLCSAAAAVWIVTPAEWWIHGVALTLVFFTGLSLLLFNFNPLIKLDGYYVLMELVDIPDLREESFEHIGNLLKKHLLRLEVQAKPIARRRRRIYLIYGIVSMVYTALVLVLMFGFLRDWLVGWLGAAGYMVLLGAMAYMFRRRIRDSARFLRHLWLDKRAWARSLRGGVTLGAGILLIVLLFAIVRTPTRIEGAFVVEPAARVIVRAPADGIVREIRVTEGRAVAAGAVLALLDSPESDDLVRLAAADRERARREQALAHASRDQAGKREWAARAEEADLRLGLLTRRREGLTLVAPEPGRISTPYLEESLGRFLRAGEPFCAVDRLDTVRLAVTTTELDIEEIRARIPVRMRLEAYPGEIWRSEVVSVSAVAQPPAASEKAALDLVRRVNLVRILVEVDNSGERLRPGMSGRIQFLTTPRSVVGKVGWQVGRWLASLVW